MKIKRLPKTISEEEFIEKIKDIKKPKVKLALMLGFYQCMRVSEVAKLQNKDVDKNRGFLHIIEAKGKKDRDVPIMKPVQKGLKHLPIGRDIRTLQRWCKQYFPEHHFHTLRHSGATFYLHKKKVSIRTIQQLLGHSNLSTTQIYTHITPTDMKEQFDEVWKE